MSWRHSVSGSSNRRPEHISRSCSTSITPRHGVGARYFSVLLYLEFRPMRTPLSVSPITRNRNRHVREGAACPSFWKRSLLRPQDFKEVFHNKDEAGANHFNSESEKRGCQINNRVRVVLASCKFLHNWPTGPYRHRAIRCLVSCFMLCSEGGTREEWSVFAKHGRSPWNRKHVSEPKILSYGGLWSVYYLAIS